MEQNMVPSHVCHQLCQTCDYHLGLHHVFHQYLIIHLLLQNTQQSLADQVSFLKGSPVLKMGKTAVLP